MSEQYKVERLKTEIKLRRQLFRIIAFVLFTILSLIMLGMYGCPEYSVYQQSKKGEAEYERAVQNRQITIEEAKAENEAAVSKALSLVKIAEAKRQADSIRAIGVARANEIIGNSLKENEAYLKYLWVTGLEGTDKIYIPTEANIPILEAKQ